MNTPLAPQSNRTGESESHPDCPQSPTAPLSRAYPLGQPASYSVLRSFCRAGDLYFLEGPHSLRSIMMSIIAHLAEDGPLYVIDGGFSSKRAQSAWRKFNKQLESQPGVLDRITLGRATSCYQVYACLEKIPASGVPPVPFIVLGLLDTFYDDRLPIAARKHLLQGCIELLDCLLKTSGGIISLSPPPVRSQESLEIYKLLEESSHKEVS